jgi:hypothetical protein
MDFSSLLDKTNNARKQGDHAEENEQAFPQNFPCFR